MRLQKFMAECGVASRRKCEELISSGLVLVNGATAEIGCTVDPDTDRVEYDGKLLSSAQDKVVIMLNKPRGVMCTSSDPEGRATVMDFFNDIPVRLYNVGRLDYDSEGLLIMTNDGELANTLMHPGFEMAKTYRVITDPPLTNAHREMLESGVMLSDGTTSPSQINNIVHTSTGKLAFDITIHEGRNRQVRRMMDAVGHVTYALKRIKLGPLILGELASGCWRYLTESELRSLNKAEQTDLVQK